MARKKVAEIEKGKVEFKERNRNGGRLLDVFPYVKIY